MAQTTATVRSATLQDVPAIIRLWEELMDFHRERDPFYTRARNGTDLFRRYIEENVGNDAACVLVAVVEDGIVGYCQGAIDHHPPVLAEQDYGQILDFMVTASHRHTGVGSQMFEALRRWFQKEGIRRIEVRHSTFNDLATRFWPRMGFKPYLQTLCMEL
jgi:GNAT superfamily N-acetyltransferase